MLRLLVFPAILLIAISASCTRAGLARTPPVTQPARPEAVSLLGRPLYAPPPGADLAKLQRDLDDAQIRLAEKPDDPDRIIWVGRRLGYLWRMNEAIAVYTDGIGLYPDYAPLYRHRGHRYLSLRRFDDAIADFEHAARLIENQNDEIEPDGMPNPRNIPLTTLGFNVWYHLGVARYAKGDFEGAVEAFRKTMDYTRGYSDNLVAVTDWLYMALRRLRRDRETAELLEPITPDMEIIENHAYFRRCLLYKGLLSPNELLDVDGAGELDLATLGYGLGNWYLVNGDREKAIHVFQRVTSGPYWPVFGFIAAEADLARLSSRPE